MNKEELNARKREWNKNKYHEDLEVSRARAREWYHKHKEELREVRRERSKAWRKNNKEKKLEYDRKYRASGKVYPILKKYREEHKEKIHEQSRLWKANHSEEVRHYESDRKSRKRANGGTVTIADWKRILDFYGYKCLCCGRQDVKLVKDHVLPIKLGGANSPDNIQPLCELCNLRKNKKHIDYRQEYIAWQK